MDVPAIRHPIATTLFAVFALGAVAAPAGAAEEHATLAIPGVNVLFLARYIADDLHLWQKEGLDVKILNINGIGSMNAVIAGSADFSMSSGPSITRAYAKGQKLVALATAIDQSGQDIVLRKDVAEAHHFDPNAPLEVRAKILKGLTLSVGGAAAIPDVVLRVVAKSAGIAPDEMTVTPMQPPETMAAFKRKAIDGFAAGPPYIQQVLLDGTGVILSDASKGEPKEYSPVSAALLLSRADFCKAHQSICRKMVQGVLAATKVIRDDPKASLAVMKAHFGTYNEKVLEAAYQMVRAMTAVPPVTTAKMLENSDDMNVRAGFIKESDKLKNYNDVIDNAYFK